MVRYYYGHLVLFAVNFLMHQRVLNTLQKLSVYPLVRDPINRDLIEIN